MEAARVWCLLEKRPLVLSVKFLVIGSDERHSPVSLRDRGQQALEVEIIRDELSRFCEVARIERVQILIDELTADILILSSNAT
jgi:hypothetical protein